MALRAMVLLMVAIVVVSAAIMVEEWSVVVMLAKSCSRRGEGKAFSPLIVLQKCPRVAFQVHAGSVEHRDDAEGADLVCSCGCDGSSGGAGDCVGG